MRVLRPRSRSQTHNSPRLVVSVVAIAAFGILTACGDSGADTAAEDQQDTTAPSGAASEPQDPTETAESADESPDEAPSEAPEPEALSDDVKLDVLLSSADLPVSPEGHSTHEGLSYFQESIAVEYTHYQEIFDESECAVSMDRINVDLIGEDPQSGLSHSYTLPAEEGADGEFQPQIYVWMLSYDREVDTSSVWDYVQEHCTGTQLESGAEQVEIEPFALEDSAELTTDGISMLIHRGGTPISSPTAIRHSMTVDFGDNLVMLSAVGLDEAEFTELAATQSQKLADYADTLNDDA